MEIGSGAHTLAHKQKYYALLKGQTQKRPESIHKEIPEKQTYKDKVNQYLPSTSCKHID